jgi:hypothetical protein
MFKKEFKFEAIFYMVPKMSVSYFLFVIFYTKLQMKIVKRKNDYC